MGRSLAGLLAAGGSVRFSVSACAVCVFSRRSPEVGSSMLSFWARGSEEGWEARSFGVERRVVKVRQPDSLGITRRESIVIWWAALYRRCREIGIADGLCCRMLDFYPAFTSRTKLEHRLPKRAGAAISLSPPNIVIIAIAALRQQHHHTRNVVPKYLPLPPRDQHFLPLPPSPSPSTPP